VLSLVGIDDEEWNNFRFNVAQKCIDLLIVLIIGDIDDDT
jgi:hypothetical protein